MRRFQRFHPVCFTYNAHLCQTTHSMLFSSSHSRSRYTCLHGSSDALALAQYASQHTPLVVIADTVKGKGVSFMEAQAKWHYGGLDSELERKAIEDIEKAR